MANGEGGSIAELAYDRDGVGSQPNDERGPGADGGHMQIARIGYDRLDPAVRAKVDALIKLNPDYSKWIGGVAEANRDRFAFVHASTRADDIKERMATRNSATPRPATTPRETSGMLISFATNIGIIWIFHFRPTERRCVRLIP